VCIFIEYIFESQISKELINIGYQSLSVIILPYSKITITFFSESSEIDKQYRENNTSIPQQQTVECHEDFDKYELHRQYQDGGEDKEVYQVAGLLR